MRRLLGERLLEFTLDRGVTGGEWPAPYAVTASLLFESLESMKAAFAEHQPALGADIPNYTNTMPVFQVSDVMEDDFTDFPSLDEIRTGYGEDSPREPID
jgi:uncharacterized protein (TIGR02118 family)